MVDNHTGLAISRKDIIEGGFYIHMDYQGLIGVIDRKSVVAIMLFVQRGSVEFKKGLIRKAGGVQQSKIRVFKG